MDVFTNGLFDAAKTTTAETEDAAKNAAAAAEDAAKTAAAAAEDAAKVAGTAGADAAKNAVSNAIPSGGLSGVTDTLTNLASDASAAIPTGAATEALTSAGGAAVDAAADLMEKPVGMIQTVVKAVKSVIHQVHAKITMARCPKPLRCPKLVDGCKTGCKGATEHCKQKCGTGKVGEALEAVTGAAENVAGKVAANIPDKLPDVPKIK